jgi:predicted Zn-dependent protease
VPILRRRLALASTGLAFAGLISFAVLAQQPDVGDPLSVPGDAPPNLGQPKDFARTPAEDEIWALYHEDKLLTARRKAEALLEAEPDSIVAHYVFGQILRRAEGSLPKAMKHLGRARELYEQKYQPSVANLQDTPWLLHRDILYAAQTLAGELERHEYQLQLLDYHDSLYDPRLIAEHAWPLMLLGRFDEAREYAEKASESRDDFQQSLGRNALCAIEGEAGTREEWFAACQAAYDSAAERAKSDKPFSRPDELTNVTVHAYNAAVAALSVSRPDEAERLAKAGTLRIEFTPANPWLLLVRLYTDQGRMSDAVLALREMQSWRRKQPPNLREQVQAETDITYATVLLIAGKTENGMRIVDRAIANPDRRGLTSSSKEQTLGAHALLRLAMRRTHAEVEAERGSWSGTKERVSIRLDGLEHDVAGWADEERIRAVLGDDQRLVRTFRMYVSGGLEPVPTWLVGDLIEVLGAGVVEVVLEMVRKAEKEELMEPYYLALDAELALHRGNETEALELAKQALDELPEFEVLLRARVAAVAGEAALELEKFDEGIELLATAMQSDAGVIRRRGLVLPAKLKNEVGGEVGERISELLERSPRFEFEGRGFEITVAKQGETIEMCLSAGDGTLLSCAQPKLEAGPTPPGAEPKPVPKPDDETLAALAVEAFHERAFAMPVGLSNIDLGSLDGTATLSDEAAREQMQGLLDKLDADVD